LEFAGNFTHATAIPQGSQTYEITPDGNDGNYYASTRRDAQRSQGILNYFLPAFQFFGEHQLKAGGDIVRIDYQQAINRGPIEYLDGAGNLVRTIRFAGSGRLNRGNRKGETYFQDSWRVRPWLQIEAGLRTEQDSVVGRPRISPRARLAVTPPSLEKLRISATITRISDPANLLLFTRPLDRSAVSTFYDIGGNVIYGPVTSAFTISSDLKNPYADVAAVTLERELPRELLARIQFLRRHLYDGFSYVNQLPASQQVPAVLGGAPNPEPVTADYLLGNLREDHYDSAEISLSQQLKGRLEWTVSYTRTRAVSNAVIEQSIDQPLIVTANTGALPWDTPNRLLSWAIFRPGVTSGL